MDDNVSRFPGLGDVIAENIGNLEGAVLRFEEIVDGLDVEFMRTELEKYKASIDELKIKMLLELLVDDEVDADAKVYMSPNDSIKAVVVALQNRGDAITEMLKADWLQP